MPYPSGISLLLLTLAISSVTVANHTSPICTNERFQISMQHLRSRDNCSSRARWTVEMRRTALQMVWKCSPFYLDEHSDIASDAMLVISVENSRGPLSVRVDKRADRTRLRNNDNDAVVAISANGTGRVDIDMQLEMHQFNPAAGTHCSTVELTITAP